MGFYDYVEETYNEQTKKIHDFFKEGSWKQLVGLYVTIPERRKTLEQARCACAAFIYLGEFSEARHLLRKYEDQASYEKEWNMLYGLSYYLQKRHGKAIRFFEMVHQMSPYDEKVLRLLRECYEKLGNKAEVTRATERLKRIKTMKAIMT
jgi:lipopolysaccharide biosynthesis regulator YciM